jgi:hypothetical protein
VRIAGFHGIRAIHTGNLGDDQLGDEPADDINEEQTQQLFSKSNYVHSDKGNVEQISKSYDELIDEEFDNDTVLIGVI